MSCPLRRFPNKAFTIFFFLPQLTIPQASVDSLQPPSNTENFLHRHALHQFLLNVSNQPFTFKVDFILRVKQSAAFGTALAFQILDLFLPANFSSRVSARVAARLASLIWRSMSLMSRSRVIFKSSAQPSSLAASSSKNLPLRSEMDCLIVALRFSVKACRGAVFYGSDRPGRTCRQQQHAPRAVFIQQYPLIRVCREYQVILSLS